MLYQMKNALIRFMYGRNGSDQLARTTLFTGLGLNILAMLLGRDSHLARIFTAAATVLVIYTFFRLFSRNLSKRREENQKFLQFFRGIQSGVAGARARHADKEHKYITCKNCKTICRVPAGKGKIVVTCPKCGAQIHSKS